MELQWRKLPSHRLSNDSGFRWRLQIFQRPCPDKRWRHGSATLDCCSWYSPVQLFRLGKYQANRLFHDRFRAWISKNQISDYMLWSLSPGSRKFPWTRFSTNISLWSFLYFRKRVFCVQEKSQNYNHRSLFLPTRDSISIFHPSPLGLGFWRFGSPHPTQSTSFLMAGPMTGWWGGLRSLKTEVFSQGQSRTQFGG